MISKFQVGLKSRLRQGMSEHGFYDDLVYGLRKIVGSIVFSLWFFKVVSHYKRNRFKINVLVLLKEPSREKGLLTFHVMTEMHFLLRKT